MKILNYKILSKIFIILITISACVNKNKMKIPNVKIPVPVSNYVIGIEGIECKVCALKAYRIIEKIINVADVKIICSEAFKNCHATLQFKDTKNNIDINNIKFGLLQEGFELEYISGKFLGYFDEKFDKFILVNSDGEKINLGDKLNQQIKFINYQKNDLISSKIKTTIEGKLIFKRNLLKDFKVQQSDDIWLTLN